ncbi:helix-turn-helix domain-containing protein [Pontiella sp.]|uniref:helix-turn-helix domain-containing protein n=1 Tax=Pontiella sp. TaxID=2837462 RepID=UPI00356B009C
MKTLVADGQDYFGMTGFPILAGRSITNPTTDDPPSHPHDLTEIEHSHDFCELAIVSQGQGLQSLEGMDLPITAGDVFLLQGRQRHFFHNRNDLIMYNVMYNPDLIMWPENELRCMPGYCAMFMLEPTYRKQHRFASRLHLKRMQLAHVEAICNEMERESKDKTPGHEIVLRAKLLELIAYLSRAYMQGESTETRALLRVGEVIGAMENDFSNDWKLDELARIAHMSKSNLLTVFRKATGQTPIDYLMRLRIQRAMEMLQQTDRTITEIAFAVGFNDSNYFTRQFRKVAGLPPRQYRTQHQGFPA